MTEICVQNRMVEAGRLCICCSTFHLVQKFLHVMQILHSQFFLLQFRKPILLPIMTSVYTQLAGVDSVIRIFKPCDQVRYSGNIFVETFLIENPYSMSGSDSVAKAMIEEITK